MPATTTQTASVTPDRLAAFGEELDAIRDRIESEIGEPDVRYIRRMQWLSNGLQVAGRGLIHFSFEPLTFTAGVVTLWLHKQLEATEIGHTALHGAYDKVPGAERWQSKSYRWRVPIDEESWHRGHNLRHHQYTNIAGKDADIHFGPVRLTEHTPWHPAHRRQLFYTLFVLFPNFAFLMNLHFTGLVDAYYGNGRAEKFDFLPDRSRKSVVDAHKRALRKYVPYYLKEYVIFPLLAGPFFWKILLGNWLSEVMRDIYSAATIFCGHVGEETATYPEGSRAHGRGQWYAMQVEAANNFEVPFGLSVLCGALDKQIEHHIFPKFPTQRLRQAAPDVKRVCEKYGVAYRTDTWPRTLQKALRHISNLSLGDARTPLLRRTSNVIEAMA